jgi:NAD+ kinase
MLEIESGLKKSYCINEISIHPLVIGRLFTVNIEVNGYPITYKGDGLVISTTSGSTAYNLSAGGPIMHPAIDAICLTPLNPFSLASRPLVIPSDATITISDKNEPSIISVDGCSTRINKGTIKLSEKKVTLVKLDNFMVDIQTKLGWNDNIRKNKVTDSNDLVNEIKRLLLSELDEHNPTEVEKYNEIIRKLC